MTTTLALSAGARSIVVTIEPSLREIAGHEPSRWRIEQGGASTRVLVRMYRLFREGAEADALLELLIEWIDEAMGIASRRDVSPPRCIRAAIELLRSRASQPLSLRHVANAVGVDQAYLSRAFRRCYGETMGETLRRFRTKRAASLLASTTLPIAEVAQRCGFADQSHMTRVFRSQCGVTPLAYRRLVR